MSTPSSSPTPTMIPCRYVGSERRHLEATPGRRYLNPDGSPLKPVQRRVPTPNGGYQTVEVYPLDADTLMLIPATEVLGETRLVDPTAQRPSLHLGAGWCPLHTETVNHEGLTWEYLRDQRFIGPDGNYWTYEFTEGRPDFVPVVIPPTPPPTSTFPTQSLPASPASADTSSDAPTLASLAAAFSGLRADAADDAAPYAERQRAQAETMEGRARSFLNLVPDAYADYEREEDGETRREDAARVLGLLHDARAYAEKCAIATARALKSAADALRLGATSAQIAAADASAESANVAAWTLAYDFALAEERYGQPCTLYLYPELATPDPAESAPSSTDAPASGTTSRKRGPTPPPSAPASNVLPAPAQSDAAASPDKSKREE